MTPAERLKEKIITDKIYRIRDGGDKFRILDELIRLSDALEILKDSYSKEEVEELLRSQRVICADEIQNRGVPIGYPKYCLNAPSPKLKGEK